MIEKLYTVEEVAELASVTGRTIRNYLKSGRLVGRKIGGQWRFPESEVQRLLTGGELADDEPESDFSTTYTQENTNLFGHAGVSPAGSAPTDDSSYPAPVPQPAPPAGVRQEATGPQSFVDSGPRIPPAAQTGAASHVSTVAFASPDSQGQTAAPSAPAQGSRQPGYPYAPQMSAPPAASATRQDAYSGPSGMADRTPVAPPAREEYAPVVESAPDYASSFQSFTDYPGTLPSQPAPQNNMPGGYGADLQNRPYPPYPRQNAAASTGQPYYPGGAGVQNPQPAPAEQSGGPQYYGAAPYVQTSAAVGAPPASMPRSEAGGNTNYSAPAAQRTAYAVNVPSYSAPVAQPVPVPPQDTASAEQAETKPQADGEASNRDSSAIPELSDVGKRVLKFVSEAHDCTAGPQVCAVIDLHQPLAAAKATSERLADIARQETESGPVCQSYVEFDERFYIARYTLIGSSSFLARCLKIVG